MGYFKQNQARIKEYMQEQFAEDSTIGTERLARLACDYFGVYTGFGIHMTMLEIAQEVTDNA